MNNEENNPTFTNSQSKVLIEDTDDDGSFPMQVELDIKEVLQQKAIIELTTISDVRKLITNLTRLERLFQEHIQKYHSEK
jgi:hypothetical protein